MSATKPKRGADSRECEAAPIYAKAFKATRGSHTPGPWKIGKRDSQRIEIDAPGSLWFTLAHVYIGDGDEGEGNANAALVAAAPYLFNIAALILEA